MLSALQKLSEAKRGEFEPGLPEIGAMLSLVEIERISRENRSKARKSERLVRWVCPSCNSVQSGYPGTNASLDRRCYKKIDKDLECGGAMAVTFDQHEGGNLGDGQGMAKWEAPEWTTR